jgi:transposase
MVGVDVPAEADGQPLVPPDVWATFPLAAQVVIVALAAGLAAERAARRGLEARVRDLEARLGQTSANSSRPPSSDPPWTRGGGSKRRPPPETGGRRAGGQPGHTGHFRALAPPERVDGVVDHWPAQRAGCAVALPRGGGRGGTYVPHHVTELPVLRAVVTEHRLHRVACGACGATTCATLPPEVPAGATGPRLQATVATLSGPYRLSRRQVVDLCGTLLDAPLSVGSVNALCQATSDALAQPVAALAATLPRAPVAHADETPWKQGRDRPWLWVAVSALATVFRIAPRRDRRVIQELIGAAYTGTLVTDRYSAYAWLDLAYRQVCWAQTIRTQSRW